MKRLNREIRRRTKAVGNFQRRGIGPHARLDPSQACSLHPAEPQRAYTNMECLREQDREQQMESAVIAGKPAIALHGPAASKMRVRKILDRTREVVSVDGWLLIVGILVVFGWILKAICRLFFGIGKVVVGDDPPRRDERL